MLLKKFEYSAQVVFQNPNCEPVLQLTIFDNEVAYKIIKMVLDVSVVGPEKERPLWKLLCFPSAPVFPHMLSPTLPALTLQSSTTQPCLIPHGSSLLFYIFLFSLYDITGEECSRHIISGRKLTFLFEQWL